MLEINARYFKKMLSTVGAIGIEKVRLHFNPEGLNILEVDNANVCIIDVFIPKENFKIYESLEVPIAININELINSLKGSKKYEDVSLHFKNDMGLLSHMQIQVYSNPEQITHTAFIPLIDMVTLRKQIKKPNKEYVVPSIVCHFTTKVKPLLGVIEGIRRFNANALRITAISENKVALEVHDKITQSDACSLEFNSHAICGSLDINLDISVTNLNEHKFTSIYSVDYLNDIIHGLSVCDYINISYGKVYPMYLTSTIKNNDKIEYLIAPRIESN
jgi:DNA polymerase III sliding clamp (beta) subunit (PCNA family)